MPGEAGAWHHGSVKRVDYSRIAETYDDLAIRREVPPDKVLIEMAGRADRPVRVLDVGCGTGSYLAAQSRALGDRVELSGIDPSDAMLSRARAKVPEAHLGVAGVEAIPYPDGSFDFVATRFAYHHFEDKPLAFRELRRVLAPGGVLFVTNVAPDRMPGWWIFRLFPEATADNVRYWPAERIAEELTTLGFEVQWQAPAATSSISLTEALEHAEKRDTSPLVMMDDATFEKRLAELRARSAAEPSASVPSEVAVLELLARLPGG